MEDEEILRRLVEIEGRDHVIDAVGGYSRRWNPLTNPADTLALIERYKVSVKPGIRNTWGAETDKSSVTDKSLPLAVALAIIEAHERGA